MADLDMAPVKIKREKKTVMTQRGTQTRDLANGLPCSN